MVTVGQLMMKDIVTVDTGTSAVEAARLMNIRNVESVLVAEKGRIVGIVTESDIVRKVVGADRKGYVIPVEEIMSSPIVRIEERRPLTEAAGMMHNHRTRHLGVTKGGTLVGVVSVRDFRPASHSFG